MKKGFTLIEMIGVMVILSLLLLIIMPNVINYIKKGGDIKDKATKEILYTAAKKYMEDNKGDFKKDKYSTYCIAVKDLSEQGYIDSPITLSSSDKDITKDTSTSVKVTYDKRYKYDVVENCEEKINPTPVLSKGLTPIKYDEENLKWVVADKTKNDWYNYDEQKWANAVTLLPGVTKNVGDEVKVDGTEASMMLVWIPRYEYKIEGDYGKDGTNAELPGEIEVNFIGKNKTTPTEGYYIHPSFTFGDQNVSGFWVGKFELSHSDETKVETSINCTTDTCSETQYLRILPNKSSLRNNTVSSFFYGIKSIENTQSFGLNNIDTHMMKNSEWGAVAYLSQSKYGKYGNKDYEGSNREVYQNKSSNYITGNSNGTASIGNSSKRDPQCSYNDMAELGNGKGQCGPGASTTGNIYGIYDMSGGAYEYMMSAYGTGTPTIRLSGFAANVFTNNSIESKYYETYRYNCENDDVCTGHALKETIGWYRDLQDFSTQNDPWFVRGGYISNGRDAGIFGFRYDSGNTNEIISTRVVFIKK